MMLKVSIFIIYLICYLIFIIFYFQFLVYNLCSCCFMLPVDCDQELVDSALQMKRNIIREVYSNLV